MIKLNPKIIFLLIFALFSLSCQQYTHQLRFVSAATTGDKEVVLELIDSPYVDINSQNNGAGPVLGHAAYEGHIEIIEILLKHGAEINLRDENGFTPLMNAVIGQKANSVKLLLERGANPNLTIKGEKAEVSALKLAKLKGNKEIITILEQAPKIDLRSDNN